jgi:hypothetical protein
MMGVIRTDMILTVIVSDGSDKNGYESHAVIVSDGSDKNEYEYHLMGVIRMDMKLIL